MIVQYSAGRGEFYKRFEWVWRLTLTVDHKHPDFADHEGELLARLNEAVVGGDTTALLQFLRTRQKRHAMRYRASARAQAKAANTKIRKETWTPPSTLVPDPEGPPPRYIRETDIPPAMSTEF